MPRPAKLQSEYKKKDQVKFVCSEKNGQETKFIHMWPLKPEMKKSSNMQLPKPAVQYNYTGLCNDKNCQSTRCYKKKSPMRPMCGDDKNCQENQTIHMWPVKSTKESSHM